MENNSTGDQELTSIDAIASMIGNMINLGGAERLLMFASHGESLLFGMTVIALSWVGIQNVLKNDGVPKLMAEVVVIILTWGLASSMIGTVNGEPITFTDSDGHTSYGLAQAINAGFDSLAGSIIGTQVSPQNHILDVIGKSTLAAAKIFEPKDGPSSTSRRRADETANDASENVVGEP